MNISNPQLRQRILTTTLVAVFIVLGWYGLSPVFAQTLPTKAPTKTPIITDSIGKISLSASLFGSDNRIVTNGEYAVHFAIYSKNREIMDPYPSNTDAGSRLWEETQTVTMKNGILRAFLGAVTPFPASLNFENADYYIGIRIGNDSEMIPRKRLGSVPSAINSQFLNGYPVGVVQNSIPLLGKGGGLTLKGGLTAAGNLLIKGKKNDISGTLNLSGNALTSGGLLLITPGSGLTVDSQSGPVFIDATGQGVTISGAATILNTSTFDLNNTGAITIGINGNAQDITFETQNFDINSTGAVTIDGTDFTYTPTGMYTVTPGGTYTVSATGAVTIDSDASSTLSGAGVNLTSDGANAITLTYASGGGTFQLTDGTTRMEVADNGDLILGDSGATTAIDGTTITLTGTTLIVGTVTQTLSDATQNALDIQEGTNNYININTTDGAEAIQFGNATTNPDYSFLGNGLTTFAGNLDMQNNLILNIGNAGTDFTATGGLTLAGDLDVNGITNDIAGTLNLSGNALTANGLLTITPISGLTVNSAGQPITMNGSIFDLNNTGAITIGTNGSAQNITFETANFDINSTGTVTIDGTNFTYTPSGTYTVTPGGTYSVDATGTVTIDSDASSTLSGAGVSITSDGTNAITLTYAAGGGTFKLTDGTTRMEVADNGDLILGDSLATTAIDGTTITLTGTTLVVGQITQTIPDNITDALDIQQGANNYININTTDGSEAIQFGNALLNPTSTFLGTGLLTVGGSIDVNGTTNDIAGTLNLSGGALTSTGALTLTPQGGNNLNIVLSAAGDFAVNTSQLYVDTSAGNVGIGTTTPSYKLDIADGTTTRGVNIANTTASSYGVYSVGTSYGVYGSDGTTSGYLGYNDTYGLYTANNAYVGGTLTVAGAMTITGDILPSADDTYDLGSSSYRWRDLYLGPTSLRIQSTAAETTTARDYRFSIQETAGTSQGNLRIWNGTTDFMNITPTGDVGIGTTVPQGRLSIAGGDVFIDASDQNNGTLPNGSVGPGLRFGGISTGEGIASKRTATGNQYGLDFYTSYINRMAIAFNGNIGIGTTVPGSALDVKGTVRLSGSNSGYVGFAPATDAGSITYTLPSADGLSSYVLATNGGAVLSWSPVNWTALGNDIYNGNSGNVGIGTTTPTGKLNVIATTEQLRLGYDAANYWSSTVGATGLLTLQGVGTGGALTLSPTAGQNINLSLSGSGDFAVNANQLYVDTSTGDVGIGTTTPATLLDIYGVTTFRGNIVFGTDNLYDIGASGASRPRSLYVGTSVYAPVFVGSLTGNADTATILQNTRTINGVDFNGSVNVTVPSHAGIDSYNLIVDNGDGTANVPANTATFLNDAGTAFTEEVIAANATLALTDGAANFVVADRNTGTWAVLASADSIDYLRYLPYAEIYRSGNYLHVQVSPLYGYMQESKNFQRISKTERYARESGLDAISVDGSLNITANGGVAWSAFTPFTIAAVTPSTTWFDAHHVASAWSITTNLGTPVIDNMNYDDGTSLQPLTAGYWTINYLYRGIEAAEQNHLYRVLGNAQYANLDLAKASNNPSSLPPIISSHAMLIGRVIVQQGTSSNYAIESAFSTVFAGSSAVTSHASLTGLTLDDHTQYSLLAGRLGGQTLIGGTAVADVLKLQGTTGVGTLTSPAIQALVGTNGGTTALTILNNGNVGIGTTGPGTLLHVAKNQNASTAITVENATNDTGAKAEITVTSNGASITMGKYSPSILAYKTISSGDSYFYNNVRGDISFLNDYAGGGFKFAAGASSVANMVITDTGNVGIGTTSPLAKLDVAGSGRFTGSATSVLTGTIDATASTAVVGVGTLFTTQLVVGDRITVTGETRTVTAITDALNLTVDTAFTDTANDTTPDKLPAIFVARDSASTVKMVINDLGNVGIGTTTPVDLLDVNGALGVTGNLVTTGFLDLNRAGIGGAVDTSAAIAARLPAGLIGVNASGYNSIWVLPSSGTVGITSFNGLYSRIDAPNVAATYQQFTAYNIGTTQRGAAATINNWTGLLVQDQTINGSGLTLGLDLTLSAGTNKFNIYSEGTAPNYFAGNVGIGTTNPQDNLHVQYSGVPITVNGANLDDGTATAATFGMTSTGAAADKGGAIRIEASNGRGFVAISGIHVDSNLDNAAMGFWTQAGAVNYERMRIDQAGNVGIGTTSPTSMLSVGASNQFQVNSTGNIVKLNNVTTSFPSSQGATGSLLTNSDGAGTLTWGSPTGTGIQGYWTRSGTNLYNTNQGDNVGIGTTAPGEKLTVQTNGIGLRLETSSEPTGYYTTLQSLWSSGHPFSLSVQGIETLGVYSADGGVTKATALMNGNVGIGTTSPAKKLELYQTDSSASLLRLSSKDSVAGSPYEAGLELYGSTIGDASTVYPLGRIYGVYDGSTYISARTTLQSVDNNGAFLDTLSLKNGNVGIGTTSPGSLLTVTGTMNGFSSNATGLSFTPNLRTNTVNWLNQTGVSINPTFDTNDSHVTKGTSLYISGARSGGYTLTNSYGLYVDAPTGATNNYAAIFNGGNVGIGTTTPTEGKLTVNATGLPYDANAGGIVINGDPRHQSSLLNVYDTSATLCVGCVRTGAKITMSQSATGGQIAVGLDVHVANADTNYAALFNGGNVGIGTTAPGGLLHLKNSDGAVDTLYLQFGGSASGGQWGINPYISGVSNGGLSITDRYGSAGTPFVISATGNIGMGYTDLIGTTGKLLINGNVGIGTTNPGAILDISSTSGTDLLLNSGNSDSIPLFGVVNSGNTWATTPAGFATFYRATDGNLEIDRRFLSTSYQVLTIERSTGNVGIGTTTIGSRLTIQGAGATSATSALNVTDSAGSSKLFVRNDGNVGIGTTNPSAAKLVVAGNVAISDGGWFGFGDVDERIAGNNAGFLQFFTSGTEKVRIDTSGNVGIGTTAPFGSLQVGTPLSSNTAALSTIANIFGTYNSARETLGLYTTNVATVDVGGVLALGGESGVGTTPYYFARIKGAKESAGATYNGYLSFETTAGSSSSVEAMRINSTGNVGIGTTNPATGKLVVNSGAAGSPPVSISQLSDNPYLELTRWTGTGTDYYGSRIKQSLGDLSFETTAAGSPGAQAYSEKMRLTGSGNVGIGTTNPGYKLEVVGGYSVLGEYNTSTRPASNGGGGMAVSWNYNVGQAETDLWNLFDNAATSFQFNQKTGASTHSSLMTILGNGNVGIGTTNPVSPLQVVASSAGINVFTLGASRANDYSWMDFKDSPAVSDGYTIGGLRMFSSLVSSNTLVGTLQFAKEGAGTDNKTFFDISTNNGSSVAERMRITSGGNVGIGTVSPLLKLDAGVVVSAGTIQDVAIFHQVSGGDPSTGQGARIYLSSTSSIGRAAAIQAVVTNGLNGHSLQFLTQTAGTQPAVNMVLDAAGNVGIGTTAPGAKLDIVDSAATGAAIRLREGSTNGIEFIGLKAPDAITTSVTYTLPTNDGTINQVLATNGSGTLSWTANSAAAGMSNPLTTIGDMVYASNTATPATAARLAIGTTGQCLVVSGGLPVWGACSGTAGVAGATTQVQYNLAGVLSATANFTWDNTNFTLSSLGSVDGNKTSLALRNTSTGNTAVDSFHIGNDTAADTLDLWVNSNANTTGANAAYIYNRSNAPLTLGTNNTAQMTILGSGNVGIGTTNPVANLQVNGTVDPYIALSNAGNVKLVIGIPTTANDFITGSAINDVAIRQSGGQKILFSTSASGVTNDLTLSAGNVGIGTTTPGTTLDVASPSGTKIRGTAGNSTGYMSYQAVDDLNLHAIEMVQYGSAAVGTYFGLARNGNNFIGASPTTLFGLGTSNATPMFFATNNLERMRIDSSGNVGIGTTSPGGLSSAGTPILGMQSGLDNGQPTIELIARNKQGTGTVGQINFGNFVSSSSTYYRTSMIGGTRDSADDAGALAFYTQATGGSLAEKMRITSTGNVGIGTTTPGYKLDVFDSASANQVMEIRRGTQAGSDPSIITAFGTPYLRVGGGEYLINSIQTIGFGYNISTAEKQPAEIGFLTTTTAGNTKGDIVFANRNGTTNVAPSEVMRITSAGNVGIGTTAPGNKLEVVAANGGHGILVYADNIGRGVRIGTSDFSGGSSTGSALSINMGAGTGNTYSSLSAATNGTSVAGNLVLQSNGGNVGIGTTGPASKLQTSAAGLSAFTGTGVGILTVDSTSSNADYFAAIDFRGEGYGIVGVPVARIASQKTNVGTNLYFGTSNSYSGGVTNSAMVIDYSGNVGIGTTGPESNLTVYGTSPALPSDGQISVIASENTGAAGTGGGLSFSGYDGLVGPRAWGSIQGLKENSVVGNVSSYLAFSTREHPAGALEKMRITSTGNVGIGTTNPGARLDIADSSSTGAAIRLREGSTNGTEFVGFKAPDAITTSVTYTLPSTDGTINQVLATNGSGTLSWTANSAAAGMSNPLTTIGDMVYASNTATPATAARLQIGTNGQCLVVTAGLPAWGACPTAIGLVPAGNTTEVQFNNAGAFGTSPNFTYDNTNFTLSSLGTIAGNKVSLALRNASTGSTATNSLHIGNDTAVDTLDLWVNSNANTAGANAAYIYNRSNAPLTLGTNNAAQMTILGNGNVGIGTTNPAAPLHIYVNNGANGTQTKMLTLSALTGYYVPNVGPYISFETGGTAETGRVGSILTSTSALTDGALVFSTLGSSTMSEKMRILGNGNVGIGTTNPLAKLAINGGSLVAGSDNFSLDISSNLSTGRLLTGGSTNISAIHTFYDNTAVEISAGSTAGYVSGIGIGSASLASAGGDAITFWTRSTEKMRINSSTGNVGIGTTSPLEKLDVNGAVRVIGAAAGNYANSGVLDYWSGQARILAFGPDATTRGKFNITILESDNGNATQALSVDNTGNVGIGTTSPTTRLDVIGGGAFQNTATYPTSGFGIEIAPNVSAGIDQIMAYNRDTSSLRQLNISSFQTLLYSNGQERMRIDSSGNVGIGTTGPGQKLTVQVATNKQVGIGVLPSTPVISDYSASGAGIGFSRESDGVSGLAGLYEYNSGSLVVAARANLVFAAGGTNDFSAAPEAMRILSSGNVGIGTTSPGEKLTVVSADNILATNIAKFQANNLTQSVGIGYQDIRENWPATRLGVNAGTTGMVNIGDVSTGGVTLATGGGNVGIGTTSPGAKLDIWNNTNNILSVYNITAGGTSRIRLLGINGAGDTNTVGDILIGNEAGVNASTYLSISTREAAGSITEKMRITSAGNVGIGTTAPGVNLEVSGIRSETSLGQSEILRLTRPNGGGGSFPQVAGFSLGRYKVQDALYEPNTRLDISLKNSNTNASVPDVTVMSLTSTGNVGIGTTDPTGRLEIAGATNPTTNMLRIIPSSNVAGVYLQTYSSDANTGQNLVLGTRHRDSVTILPTGSVGIGTTNPSTYGAQLVSYNAGGAGTYLGHSGAGGTYPKVSALGFGADSVAYTYTSNGSTFTLSGSAQIAAIQSAALNATTDMAFYTTTGGNVSERMRISSGGGIKFNAYGAGTLVTDASGNVSASSDSRLKNVDGAFTSGLVAIRGLTPQLYHWNAESGLDQTTQYAGFIAQNVQQYIPEAVGVDPRGYLTLQDRPIEAALVNAVKELDQNITNKNTQNDALIAGLNLKTDTNITTLIGLQSSVDSQLLIASNKIDAITAVDVKQAASITALEDAETKQNTSITTMQASITALMTFFTDATLGNIILKDASGNVDLLSGNLQATKITTINGFVIDTSHSTAPTIGTATLYPIAVDINPVDGNDDYTGLPMGDATVKARDGKSIVVPTSAVSTGSRIFVTPKINLNEPLAVTDKHVGVDFTVSLKNTTTDPITFDWLLIEEK